MEVVQPQWPASCSCFITITYVHPSCLKRVAEGGPPNGYIRASESSSHAIVQRDTYQCCANVDEEHLEDESRRRDYLAHGKLNLKSDMLEIQMGLLNS